MDTSNKQIMGIIRSIDDEQAYNNDLHKPEYDKLCEFVINYV